MIKQDYCKYVDVFYGNGETDRFFDDGLASKWFYIKAQCGNTNPHAVLPFGKMSVGAYSGGYPTGYGMLYPNSCGGIKKLGEVHMVKGFTHLHQSGTGGIQYYYNYALTTPFYGNDISAKDEAHPLEDEAARPGYYKAKLQDVLCELTVDGSVALHRYTFGKDDGRLAVDFSNNGLSEAFGERFFSDVKKPELEIVSNSEAAFSGVFSGVKLYFFVKVECDSPKSQIFEKYSKEKDKEVPFGVIFDFGGNSILLKVAYSTVSADLARDAVQKQSRAFDSASDEAYSVWNTTLSAFDIKSDDEEFKQKFYSCLYHSLIKPCDMTGESIMGISGDTVADIATFWDQYKTTLPLIYMCYPEMGEKIARGIVNISRTLGKIPCSLGISDVFPCEEQAKMLGILSLCDAYYMGYSVASAAVIEECVERELQRKDYATFLENGYFERYTHILDVTDACLDTFEISENTELKSRLIELSKHWRNAYSKDGYMSEDSNYYEGDRYTYSFRIQKNMEERVALCGGKDRFADMLDRFFGFGGESVKQLTYVGASKEINEKNYHRFEGFNNECDMETPYAYIYADRHDRLCEIMNECVSRSFGLGRSGLPGNNDSGGLSSMFVFNALGIFPVSGSGEFLIGSPYIDSADIVLATKKTLHIRTECQSKQHIYVDRVEWNGKKIDGYRISVTDIMNGGTLKFYMK